MIQNIDDGRYINVNDNFCKQSGYSREEAIGKTSVELEFITDLDRKKMIDDDNNFQLSLNFFSID